MYSYTYDEETGGILLNSTPTIFSKEPRPVYAPELDLLGFDKYWKYDNQSDIPYMWAESVQYWYRGKQVAKLKGGNLYEAPEIIISKDMEGNLVQPEPDGGALRPVDIDRMVKKNLDMIDIIENTTIKKIVNVYEKYKNKLDIFHIAFSGGKDSAVLLDLVKRALPKGSFVVVFGDTGMEFPDTYAAVEKEIKEKREQARYDEVVSDAAATLADARLEADTQFADADAKITDARAELDDGKIRLADGWQQLQDGIRQLNEQKKSAAEQFRQGYVKISDGYTQLASGEQQLTSGKAELKEHQVQLNQGAATLQQQKTAVMQELSNAEIQLTQGQQQASDGKEQILAQVSQIQTQMGDAWPQDSWKSYETAVENGSTYNSEKTTFQTDLKTRIEVLNAALDTQILQLDPNAADYDMQKQVLEDRKTQLLQIPDGMSTLETQYESLQTTLFKA